MEKKVIIPEQVSAYVERLFFEFRSIPILMAIPFTKWIY